mmetsp:Transcript_12478/g.41099  ORF Transcript_12478/g.41099 Transcript_12478/m.41099 type:complete len:243 (-) Transcript_12478:1578-2306(-)
MKIGATNTMPPIKCAYRSHIASGTLPSLRSSSCIPRGFPPPLTTTAEAEAAVTVAPCAAAAGEPGIPAELPPVTSSFLAVGDDGASAADPVSAPSSAPTFSLSSVVAASSSSRVSSANAPLASTRSWYRPCSTSSPSLRSTTWPTSGSTLSLLVTRMRVDPARIPASPISSCISTSAVCPSTAASGSSKRYTSARRYAARASATRCFCPPEMVMPRSPSIVCSPSGSCSRSGLNAHASMHFQ